MCYLPVAALDDWLKRRARMRRAARRTLSAIAIELWATMRSLPVPSRKWQARVAFAVNMPDLSPVVVLVRLAIDRSHQGKAIGRALFRDSGLWVLQAADIISGLLIDAISGEAKAFYLALGMTPSPLDLMTLMVTLQN